jgi:hypothetical protein
MTLKCPICWDILKMDACTTPCGHLFHKSCLNKWLESQQNCPQCREPCRKEILRLFLSPNTEESGGSASGQIQVLGAQYSDLFNGLGSKVDKMSGVLNDLKTAFLASETRNLDNSQALRTQIDNLSVVLGNKIDKVSGAVQNFGTIFSAWRTQNLNLSEENGQLNLQNWHLQAENTELYQKFQNILMIERCYSGNLATLNALLEEKINHLKMVLDDSRISTKKEDILGVQEIGSNYVRKYFS